MIRCFLFTLCLLSLPFYTVKAQNIDSERVKTISLNGSGRLLNDDYSFTSILLQSNQPQNFQEYGIKIGQDTLFFYNAAHAPDNLYQSSLIHFDQPQRTFELVTPADNAQVSLILINAAGGNKPKGDNKKKAINQSPCFGPEIVSQAEWRCGLNEPNYNRAFTEVRNIIVHHSAGSNAASDYQQQVRAIYLLHTQSNGWADLGYNYLIDPAGTIYAGRDPGTGAQDNVRGAHFCGSNSNTMGICLMGNYELIQASDTAYAALNALLSWKINKEDQLTAMGVRTHPLNDSLSHVSGHRDGCATACPGQFVYDRLPEIRLEVEAIVATCEPYDPANDPDNSGADFTCDDDDDGGDDDGDDDDGDDDDGDDNGDDDLDNEPDKDVINLNFGENIELADYTIYPNPINNNKIFKIALSKEEQNAIEDIMIVNNSGDQMGISRVAERHNYITVYLSNQLIPGLYYVSFIKNDKIISRKFVVE